MIKRKNTKKNRKYKLKKTQKGGAAALALAAVRNPGATLAAYKLSSGVLRAGQGSAQSLSGLAQVIRSKVPMSSQFTNVVKAAKLGNLGNLASRIKASTVASNGFSKLKSLISASSPLKQQGLATPLKQQGLATSTGTPLKQHGSIPFSIGRPQTPLPFKSAAASAATGAMKAKAKAWKF